MIATLNVVSVNSPQTPEIVTAQWPVCKSTALPEYDVSTQQTTNQIVTNSVVRVVPEQ
jgi:hypothetical protein